MICKELTINGRPYEVKERYILGTWCLEDPQTCADCPEYDLTCLELSAYCYQKAIDRGMAYREN